MNRRTPQQAAAGGIEPGTSLPATDLPAGRRVADLQKQNTELRAENAQLRADNTRLRE